MLAPRCREDSASRCRPSDFVYEYEGPWEDFPGFFRLKVLGEDAWRSFPLIDVLRLEPSNRMRPKGLGNSDLGMFERSPLDQLLDLSTCGNNSVVRNVALVHMARAQFARIADAVILAPRPVRQFPRLSRFLPWGSIAHNGELEPNDPYQIAGEPLVAVTGVAEDLAKACMLGERATKIVFVDGARRLARDLQAFDDISDRQSLVILASPEEGEDLDLLRDRGCPVWQMSAREILAGETFAPERSRTSLVGATIRAADIRRRAKVSNMDCHDEALEAAAALLERAAYTIGDRDDVLEVEEALARLFSVLFECSECWFGVADETVRDLNTASKYLERNARWLDPAIAEALREATGTLDQAITGNAGREKAEAFLGLLADEAVERVGLWVVAARSPRTAERLRMGLGALGSDLPVIPISAMTPDQEYSGAIVPAWPNDQRFTRLKNLAVAPEIRVLTYPFEKKWLLRHEARERMRSRANTISPEDRATILGVEPAVFTALDRAETGHTPELTSLREVQLDLPVFRFEERVAQRRLAQPQIAADGEEMREVQLVWFAGGCYALLTEWAKLPMLNELVDNSKGDKARLVGTTAARLSPGDFVLFRAGGDKEFRRQIAEEITGVEEYQRIRDVAERWKSALRRLGSSPALVQRRLADHGLDRTSVTVAGWLGDPDRIGPGDYSDVEVIARVAEDTDLLSTKSEVREAISRIRGAHQAAGMRLTKLILGELHGRLRELGDQPVLLDLGYGQAWVVQVESVDAKRGADPFLRHHPRPCPRAIAYYA